PLDTKLSFVDRWSPSRFEPSGKMFLLPPGQPLRVRTREGRQDALICNLFIEPVRKWIEDDIEWTDRRLDASVDVASFAVRNLLLQLGEEALHPGFASDVLCEALAVQIAVNLQRYYNGLGEAPPAGALAPWRLKLIDERLRDFDQAPTLSELAELCTLSVRHL